MKIVEKNDNQLVFTADIEESLANTIRRYVNEIPVLAVDNVEISRNDSALYDETIAHRIGLIPLKTEKIVKENATGKISLKAKKAGMVYSGEFEGDIKPVYNEIPITLLNKDQELDIVANIKAGTGNEHSKFSPGLLFYRNIVEIKVDSDLKNEIKNVCLNNEIKESGKTLTILDDKKKEVADACEEIAKDHGKKAEVEIKDGLVITIESFGQINVNDIFVKAIEVLKKDLAEISKKVK
jgi:DNA-directed RNA polymerase subunit D